MVLRLEYPGRNKYGREKQIRLLKTRQLALSAVENHSSGDWGAIQPTMFDVDRGNGRLNPRLRPEILTYVPRPLLSRFSRRRQYSVHKSCKHLPPTVTPDRRGSLLSRSAGWKHAYALLGTYPGCMDLMFSPYSYTHKTLPAFG